MAYIVTYDEMMSKDSMQALCPSAKMRLGCRLLGCRLVLRRFFAGAEFSIEQGAADDSAPTVVWEIDDADEKDLMEYYPKDLYEKIFFKLKTGKTPMAVSTFILRCREIALPDEECIEKIAAAYEEHGFEFWFVEQALDFAADSLKGGNGDGIIHAGTAGTGKQRQP